MGRRLKVRLGTKLGWRGAGDGSKSYTKLGDARVACCLAEGSCRWNGTKSAPDDKIPFRNGIIAIWSRVCPKSSGSLSGQSGVDGGGRPQLWMVCGTLSGSAVISAGNQASAPAEGNKCRVMTSKIPIT